MDQAGGGPVTLQPIGVVRNGVRAPRPDGWAAVESRLELAPAYAAGLRGLDGFSHVMVVCWLHLVPDALRTVAVEPPAPGLPAVGVFAARTQRRPNPLGLTVAAVVKVEEGALTVRGLDAVDGTPVLDLRPYLPPYDSVPDARMPAWVWGG